MNKAEKILTKIKEQIGGSLIISRRGVPYLFFDYTKEKYSVCYFASTHTLRTFTGCRTGENKKYKDYKDYHVLIKEFKNILSTDEWWVK